MEVKLLAIDVDGTLLNDDYQVTYRTKQALAMMKELGVKVVLATGRGPQSCYPIIEELGIKDPMITHNGALIVDPLTKEKTLEIGYQAEELIPLIQYCRSRKIHFDVNTAFDMYIEGVTTEASKMYEKFFVHPNIVEDTSLLKEQIVKFTLFGVEEEMDIAMEEMKTLFPDLYIIRSGETFIDIIHPEATKGTGLKHLLAEFHISPEEVIAFGNYYNDLEMLRIAGRGIAMANSPQEVKEAADQVTHSNNEEGVALILEEIIVGNRK